MVFWKSTERFWTKQREYWLPVSKSTAAFDLEAANVDGLSYKHLNHLCNLKMWDNQENRFFHGLGYQRKQIFESKKTFKAMKSVIDL